MLFARDNYSVQLGDESGKLKARSRYLLSAGVGTERGSPPQPHSPPRYSTTQKTKMRTGCAEPSTCRSFPSGQPQKAQAGQQRLVQPRRVLLVPWPARFGLIAMWLEMLARGFCSAGQSRCIPKSVRGAPFVDKIADSIALEEV